MAGVMSELEIVKEVEVAELEAWITGYCRRLGGSRF